MEPLRAHELQGRRVVLVDDVMTSGTSLFAAAAALRLAGAALRLAGAALRLAGAAHVTALVFARTDPPH